MDLKVYCKLLLHLIPLLGLTILSLLTLACSGAVQCTNQGADNRPSVCDKLPPISSQSSPYWYKINDTSDTVIVFIHGIFGNSRDTWLYTDQSSIDKSDYWPAIVFDDQQGFAKPSIFLAGYYTDPGSGEFGLTDISKELFNALNSRDSANRRVLDKRNILFVAHSTGGLVVRHTLLHHKDVFRPKAVGLILMASPSYGSRLANTLGWVAAIFNNRLAKELQWGSSSIIELDNDFKDVVLDQELPDLECREAVENHFIVHFSWLPVFSEASVVDRSSASRYCKYEMIADSNHSSIVKPSEPAHRSHQFLARFYNNDFKRLALGGSRSEWTVLLSASGIQYGPMRVIKQIYVLGNFTGTNSIQYSLAYLEHRKD